MPCVYALHTDSGEIRYIGFSQDDEPKRRFHVHKLNAASGRKLPVYDWMRKHGDSVRITVLENGMSIEDAKNEEVRFIKELKEKGHRLLNVTLGGDGVHGYKHSEESKAKMRLAKLGVPRSEEAKRAVSEGQRGRVHSEETIKKMSEAQKGKPRKPNSPEARAKISKALTGKKRAPFTEEHRRRISEAGKGKIPWNKKMKEANG